MQSPPFHRSSANPGAARFTPIRRWSFGRTGARSRPRHRATRSSKRPRHTSGAGRPWRWGRVYAGTTFVEAPLKNGLLRTLNWAGFHAAIVIAAVGQASWPVHSERRRWLVWLPISFVGVAAGP